MVVLKGGGDTSLIRNRHPVGPYSRTVTANQAKSSVVGMLGHQVHPGPIELCYQLNDYRFHHLGLDDDFLVSCRGAPERQALHPHPGTLHLNL